MSDTDNTAAAPDAAADTADDDQAQEALGTASQHTTPDSEGSGKADTAEQDSQDSGKDKDWKAETEKWRALARKHESKVKELSPLAQKAQEAEDAKKSEVDKLTEQLTESQVALQEYRVAEVRSAAAERAGLTGTWAKRIVATDPDEALAEAKQLKKDIDALAEPAEPARADFRQGAQGRQPAPKQGAGDWLRDMAAQRNG